jgi:hypothetical protein
MISLLAVSYYLALHGDAPLAERIVRSHQIVRHQAGAAHVVLSLPETVALAGLHREASGAWLFSLEAAAVLGDVAIESRDVARFDGSTYSIAMSGAALGIEEGVGIDALVIDPNGAFVLSFDTPTDQFSAADLVRWNPSSGWEFVWRAADAGIPASINLVGADFDAQQALVLGFDGPFELGGIAYPLGALLEWDGAALAPYFIDGSWPETTERADFVLSRGGAGEASDALWLSKLDDQLRLTWEPAHCGDSDDFAIYEGVLGEFQNHLPITCTTGGALSVTISPEQQNAYYLVVARNVSEEGSYGRRSDGTQRTPSQSSCAPQVVASGCP